jgi:hypothetical protein
MASYSIYFFYFEPENNYYRFEQSAFLEINKVFPEVKFQGCFFISASPYGEMY